MVRQVGQGVGEPPEGDHPGRPADHGGAGHLGELRGEDQGTNGVPEAHQHHQAYPLSRPVAEVQTNEHGHAGTTQCEAEQAL